MTMRQRKKQYMTMRQREKKYMTMRQRKKTVYDYETKANPSERYLNPSSGIKTP